MPLYEYECEQCGERVEVIQNLSDAPYAHCPKCGGGMKKLFSAPAIQFRGSGFYKTDYPSKSATSSESTGEPKANSTNLKSESDSKSESKKSESKTE